MSLPLHLAGRIPAAATRRLLGLILVLLSASGCTAFLKPSDASRAASAARASTELAPHRERLRRAGFLVFASPHHLDVRLTLTNGQAHLGVTPARFSAGLATAFTSDGYLLTASHVLARSNWVIGWCNHRVSVLPARVVTRIKTPELGREFAVLHVDAVPDFPLELARPDPSDSRIYAIAFDWRNRFQPLPLVGQRRGKPSRRHGERFSLQSTDLPIWKGDSGGAALTADGQLVGIATAVKILPTEFRISRTICLPDPEYLMELVEADRRTAPRSATAPPP